MTDRSFTPVAPAADVPPGTVKPVTVAGTSILLCHDGDAGLFAIENRCSHLDEPLECGRLRFGWIACPLHGAKFDLETGEALSLPAVDPIATYPLRVSDGTIEVAV